MFWATTPRQLGTLLDRYDQRKREQDRRAGEVVAILYNVNVDRKKNPKGITWLDVFPEHREPAPVQNEESMLNVMMAWAKATEPT